MFKVFFSIQIQNKLIAYQFKENKIGNQKIGLKIFILFQYGLRQLIQIFFENLKKYPYEYLKKSNGVKSGERGP